MWPKLTARLLSAKYKGAREPDYQLPNLQVSSDEGAPGWLDYIGDYTIQLYLDLPRYVKISALKGRFFRVIFGTTLTHTKGRSSDIFCDYSKPFFQDPGINPSSTLPETNIAPKNGWLEYHFPIGEAYFQGLC